MAQKDQNYVRTSYREVLGRPQLPQNPRISHKGQDSPRCGGKLARNSLFATDVLARWETMAAVTSSGPSLGEAWPSEYVLWRERERAKNCLSRETLCGFVVKKTDKGQVETRKLHSRAKAPSSGLIDLPLILEVFSATQNTEKIRQSSQPVQMLTKVTKTQAHTCRHDEDVRVRGKYNVKQPDALAKLDL